MWVSGKQTATFKMWSTISDNMKQVVLDVSKSMDMSGKKTSKAKMWNTISADWKQAILDVGQL
jgi:hypothetical protein